MAAGDERAPDRAFVWAWLPGRTEPVPAGVLQADGDVLAFTYDGGYLDRDDAISLSLPDLPLQRGSRRPSGGRVVAGALRDAGPDAWGRRLVLARRPGRPYADGDDLGLLTYLLGSGSDRIGGLDFQTSAETYVPRLTTSTSLAQLQEAADTFLAGEPLTRALEAALLRGTSVGGSRPKVLLRDTAPDGSRRGWVAKLSAQTDSYPVVRSEAVAMDLARRVGLDVPQTLLEESLGKDVLLVERFDRVPAAGDSETTGSRRQVTRRMMVSALTVLDLDETSARAASYPALADQIRTRFTDPDRTLRELFSRVVFNICVSNTDDHPRNHAAFWDGHDLTLTPAYDLTPQPRSSENAEQAMAIDRAGRREARLSVCLDAADIYRLDRAEATDIVERQVTVIREQWDDAADAARLTAADRQLLWERQILNPASCSGSEGRSD
jgi:serine/threonine-protein kinase HipA